MTYNEATTKARKINQDVHAGVSKISCADSEYKRQSGNDCTAELLPEAQQAAERVIHKGKRQLADLSAEVSKRNDPAYVEQVLTVIAAGGVLIEAIAALEAPESARDAFLAEAKQPGRPHVFDRDLIAKLRDYQARSRRVVELIEVPVAKKATRLPVSLPDFAAMVR